MKKLLSISAGLVSLGIVSSVFADPSTSVDVAQSSSSSGGGFGIIALITPLFIYGFYAWCAYTLAKKLNVEGAWLAWVPFLSVIPFLRSAGMSAWWILGLFVPLLNIYVIVKMCHVGISLRTGHGAGWTVGLVLLGAIMFPITALTYQPTATPIPNIQ